MNSKFFKCLIVGCLTFVASGSFAEEPIYDRLLPGSCSNMSKDPRCWEEKDNTHNPRPNLCEGKRDESCEIIESVHAGRLGGYYCKATVNEVFDCSALVQEFGVNLKGVVVKVIVPYIDICHAPGGCGPKACMPSIGSAILDQSCQ